MSVVHVLEIASLFTRRAALTGLIAGASLASGSTHPARGQELQSVSLGVESARNSSEVHARLIALAEAQKVYEDQARALARVKVRRSTESEDTRKVEEVCLQLERAAADVEAKARALQETAPAARASLDLLAGRANLAWGTAMAIRSVMAPPTPLERKQEVVAVSRWLRGVADEMDLLIDGIGSEL
jgi:hypothetical protein